MRQDLGCELGERGRSELRHAIAAVLFAAAALSAHTAMAQSQGDIKTFPNVRAVAPSWMYFGGGWGGGGYDTSGPSDPGSYGEVTPKPGTPGSDSRYKCEYGRGNPIYMSNANKIERDLDFADADVEMPLYFERVYNRNASAASWFVFGMASLWSTSFDYQFDAGQFFARRPDGTTLYFDTQATNGRYMELKADAVRYVMQHDNGTYTLHRGDGVVEVYEPVGTNGFARVLEIKNTRGVGWTFSYGGTGGQDTQPSTITHTSGKKVRIEYANGRASKVWDTAGNLYQYGGDAEQGSTYMIAPDGTNLTYHYSQEDGVPAYIAQFELTGKSYDGVRYSRFRWAAPSEQWSGMRLPVSSEHAGGVEKFQFAYTLKDGEGSVVSVEETNPLGKKATYRFDEGKLLSVTGQPSPSCIGTVSSMTYDDNGNRDKVTDSRGTVTDYDYSPGGRLLRQADALGTAQQRTTEFRWDPARTWLLESKMLGLKQVNYVYNADERLAEVVETNLSSNGVPGQTRKIGYAYTYHPNGKLATVSVDGPLAGNGDTTVSTYSAAGELQSFANSLGHTVSYANYNGLGLPGRVTGVNGDVTEYDYDARGRVVAERKLTQAGTAETRYRYAHGLLAASTSPDGVETRYLYDAARRLTDEYRSEGDGWYSRRRYVLNNASQPTSVEVSRANYPPDTALYGNVDGILREGNQYTLSGWACATGMNDSIDVQVFAGATAVATVRADAASEPAIAGHCGTQRDRYRFRVPLTLELRQRYGGQALSVWAIAPTGASTANVGLNGSGVHTIPAAPVIGDINAITNDGQWNYFVEGWACSVGVSAPIEVSLFVGGPYGGGGTVVGGRHRADGAASEGVQQACESSGSNAYRFRIPLPVSARRQFGGQRIYVHGISPVGHGDPVLNSSGNFTVPAAIDNAELVSYQIPAHMISGDVRTITVQMRNTGNLIWGTAETGNYYLGKDSVLYAQPERIAIAGPVAPGQIATFSYTFRAGRTPTSQNIRVPFGGRMIGDGAGWFGAAAPIQYITVEDPTKHCTGTICENPR